MKYVCLFFLVYPHLCVFWTHFLHFSEPSESTEKQDSVRADSTESQDTQPTPTDRTEREADTEPVPSGVQQSSSDVQESPSDVQESPSDVQESPSDVQYPPSDIQQSDPQQPTSDTQQHPSKIQPSQEPQTEQQQLSSDTAKKLSQDFAGGVAHSQQDSSPTCDSKLDPRGLEDTDEFSNLQAEKKLDEKKVSAPSIPPAVTTPEGLGERYIFAVHRKIVS